MSIFIRRNPPEFDARDLFTGKFVSDIVGARVSAALGLPAENHDGLAVVGGFDVGGRVFTRHELEWAIAVAYPEAKA